MTVTDPTLRVPCYANFGHERQHHTQSGFRALMNNGLLSDIDWELHLVIMNTLFEASFAIKRSDLIRIPPTLRNFTVALWMSTSKHFKGHTARVHIWWLEAQNAFFGPQGPCLVLLWPCVHTFYCHSWHSLFCPLHALECRQIKFFWLLQLSTPWEKGLLNRFTTFLVSL